jgi:hypothetical protein
MFAHESDEVGANDGLPPDKAVFAVVEPRNVLPAPSSDGVHQAATWRQLLG